MWPSLMTGSVVSFFASPKSVAPAPAGAASALAQTMPLRQLWWAATFLLGFSVTAVGWTIWQLRTDAINAATTESGNIATILASQLSRSLGAFNIVLQDVERSTEGQNIDSPADLHTAFSDPEFHELLRTYLARLPQAFAIVMADRNGQLVASTAAWPAPKINIADRDYFQDARTRSDRQLSISIPTRNRIDGAETIIFARRLQSSTGNFAGVIFVSVGTKYFQDIYGAVQSVHNLLFTLLNPDGRILFRHPAGSDAVGSELTKMAPWREALAKGDAGFRVHSRSDGNIRYVSVRQVPGYPLIVDISVTESTALATWGRRAAGIGAGSLVVLLFSIYLLRAMAKQFRLLSNSEASLAQKSRELERMARYDALTGLANRNLFMEKADAAVAQMRRCGEVFSVLMLDLDRFKTVNDSLGHPAGDALLREAARRVQETVRDIDCVARLGGDEFAVLQGPGKDQRDGAIVLAKRILKAISEPFDLGGRQVVVETSIGIALAPRNGSSADALIKNADLALYKAKAEGRNRYSFFESAMAAQARQRQDLEDDMRKALVRNEFELHYQPIIDLGTQDYCAAEALVRWRHPQRGLIAPDQFIPLAEESGLIIPLGEWILRRASADAANWPPHVKVAINLSPAQLKQNNLVGVLKSALDNAKLPPSRIELEITENVLLEKKESNLAVLHAIKELGVSIVLDDFGTGYSSMTYLQTFPFDRIKIDQTFIQNMTNNAASAAIVCAISGLGRNLDIATTGEGVETLQQLVFLRAAGCQSAQGYLFSRPVPIAELTFELPEALRQRLQAA
jgi:diguanylate cyclase (GGDEF)-like protein